MGIETGPWDTAEFLENRKAILACMEAVFGDGDPGPIALALNKLARARGLAHDALTAQSDIASAIGILKSLGSNSASRPPEGWDPATPRGEATRGEAAILSF